MRNSFAYVLEDRSINCHAYKYAYLFNSIIAFNFLSRFVRFIFFYWIIFTTIIGNILMYSSDIRNEILAIRILFYTLRKKGQTRIRVDNYVSWNSIIDPSRSLPSNNVCMFRLYALLPCFVCKFLVECFVCKFLVECFVCMICLHVFSYEYVFFKLNDPIN